MPAVSSGGVLTAVTDGVAYDQAYSLIQQRNWTAAQQAFSSFLAAYPASNQRGNAQYWLAESYYAQLEFQTALREFQKVIDEYPQSAKVPDALLKIGYSHYEMRNMDAARQALMQVLRQYPDANAASLAEQRLSQIAQEAG